MKKLPGKMALGAISIRIALLPAHAVEEVPAEILAAQIRDQGFVCNKALSAERDQKLSKPDEAAWVLKCDNASYRVRLIPDMAAKVERID
jgi:hypothetical protein